MGKLSQGLLGVFTERPREFSVSRARVLGEVLCQVLGTQGQTTHVSYLRGARSLVKERDPKTVTVSV